MGYRVDYQSVKKLRGAEKRVARVASLTALFFVLFLLGVTCLWPEGRSAMRQLLCPGEAVAAAEALEAFAAELENNVELETALENLRAKLDDEAVFDSD